MTLELRYTEVMSFIIAITGPTGSGKSTVAKQIANSVSNCVNIDVDVVKHFIHSGFIYDDSPEGIAQWELLGINLGQLAANFKQAGYNVVVNGYLNVPAWSKLQSFVSFDSRFLLSPDIQTIIERDASRSEDDTMGEKAVRTHNTFFSTDPYFDDFIKINSTEHTVQETVAIILDYVNAPTQTTVNDRGNGAQNLCQIVDDQDNIIGAKPRNEIDFKKDCFRSSGLWLTNSKGQVLIAQRSLSKDKDPGKWGSSSRHSGGWRNLRIECPQRSIRRTWTNETQFNNWLKNESRKSTQMFLQMVYGHLRLARRTSCTTADRSRAG